jgi:ABC-2 type transport system ATP-binding protein
MPPLSLSSPAIGLYSVTKAFRSVVAVDEASFEVKSGEVFGLLGPNGAGKTTLLRLIMDIFRPDSGSIQVFGRRLLKEDKGRIGYLPEERGLYTRQKVQAVIEYFVQLKGVPQPQARASALHWLQRLDMLTVKDRKVQELSKGNQQKVQFIATVAAEPEILVLDEPFAGLDPVNARAVIQTIQELAASGKTIVLSTHQMNLVESLCQRVFMIHRGRQVLYGELDQIQRAHSEKAIMVRSDATYTECPFIAQTAANGRTTQILLKDNRQPRDLLAWLVETGAEVESFECAKTPLEDIFISMVQP